ncbi:MAG: hypothetical protein WBW48_07280 [Anaerolineae bacterium]
MPVGEGGESGGDDPYPAGEHLAEEQEGKGDGGDADQGRGQTDAQGPDPHQAENGGHEIHVEGFPAGVGGEENGEVAMVDVQGHQPVDRLVEVEAGGRRVEPEEPQSCPYGRD